MAREHYIELVGKIVKVLESMRDEPGGLSLQELAFRTGYVKSSIHRILQSLKRHDYIEQEGSGTNYRLGIRVLALARGLGARGELVRCAHPFLRELVDIYDESAYLAVLRGGKGIFVDVQESHRDFRIIGPVGADVHFHATAAGKAMAAFFSTDRISEILRSQPPRAITPHTFTNPEFVEKDLIEVRQRGYAVNDEETILGAVFLAAPIFDARSTVCGSITVGIPKVRLTAHLKAQIADSVKDCCRKLTDQLKAIGYIHSIGTDHPGL